MVLSEASGHRRRSEDRGRPKAADQLSKPRHSMLYPAYTRLMDALGAVRLKCNDIRLAIRAHRKELRDKGK
jgi:hypothetical protein